PTRCASSTGSAAYRLLVSQGMTQRLHLPSHRVSSSDDGVGGGGSATEDKEEEWVVRDRLVARQRVVGMLRYLGVPWKEFVRDVEGLEGENGVLGRGVYKGVGEGRSGWGENRGLRCNVDENTRIVW
ncbi:hypothetical protein PMIN04_008173, partial [Paraphaeosphaeria minitans]